MYFTSHRAVFALAIAAATLPVVAIAQPATTAPTPAATAAPATANQPLSTSTTAIGTLLDNPAARAVLVRHLPELVASEQIAMARGMTLRVVQAYAPDMITDAKLAQIDQELAQLPAQP